MSISMRKKRNAVTLQIR